MSTLTRHPSTPRKTPPPPRREFAVPVLVCARCHDPVVPDVRTGVDPVTALVLFLLGVIPGLIYIFLASAQRSASCPNCGASELVPLDSTRGREIVGDAYDQVAAAARRRAVAAGNAAQAARAREHRLAVRGLVALVVAGLAIGGGAWWWHVDGERKREALRAELEQQARENAALIAAKEQEDAEREQARAVAAAESGRASSAFNRPPKPVPGVVLADGVAVAKPVAGAEPVMRLTAGETYQLGEERDGFLKIADAPGGVEAWVATNQVRR